MYKNNVSSRILVNILYFHTICVRCTSFSFREACQIVFSRPHWFTTLKSNFLCPPQDLQSILKFRCWLRICREASAGRSVRKIFSFWIISTLLSIYFILSLCALALALFSQTNGSIEKMFPYLCEYSIMNNLKKAFFAVNVKILLLLKDRESSWMLTMLCKWRFLKGICTKFEKWKTFLCVHKFCDLYLHSILMLKSHMVYNYTSRIFLWISNLWLF